MKYFKQIGLGLLFFTSTFIFGQESKITFGFEGGLGVRSLYGFNAAENSETTLGYAGGVFFQYNINAKFSLRTNVFFERKGNSREVLISNIQDSGGVLGTTNLYQNFDFLTIPLLIKYSFSPNNRFYINSGPFFGFLLKHSLTENTTDFFQSNTEDFKTLDFGWSNGLGLNFPINEHILLSLEVRNNLGLIHIGKQAVINNERIKTNSTNLLMGLGYKL